MIHYILDYCLYKFNAICPSLVPGLPIATTFPFVEIIANELSRDKPPLKIQSADDIQVEVVLACGPDDDSSTYGLPDSSYNLPNLISNIVLSLNITTIP